MTKFWKGLSLSGVLLGGIALGVAITHGSREYQHRIAADVLAEREKALVTKAKRSVERVREAIRLPARDIQTMEELFTGFFECFEGVGALPKK